MNSNEKKSVRLGMSFNKARHMLMKSILFDLIKKLNLDICYRCNKKIETVKELSVEHKEHWLNSDNPKEKFFDLNNIAFSHLKCNIMDGEKPEKQGVKHGTHQGYTRYNCRCDKCTEIHRQIIMNNRKKNGRKKYPVHSIPAWSSVGDTLA
jgi:hypothetical protein